MSAGLRNGAPRRPGSLQSRLEQLYTDAPHEWFTMSDLALQLSAEEKSIRTAIENLAKAGRVRIRAVTVFARMDE